jgi:MFS family permease
VSDRLRPVHGVALLFVANGLGHPALWPRLPEIQDAVGAGPGTFGLALVGVGVGGAVGSVLAPRVASWVGVPRAATVSAALLVVATVSVGFAPSVVALFVAFAVLGVTDGVADVSQNALLFDVQRLGDRSLASRAHAAWSAGALVATALGTVAATVGVGVVAQTAGIGSLALVLIAVAWTVTSTSPRPSRTAVAAAPARDDIPASRPTRAAAAAAPADGEPSSRRRRRTGAWLLIGVTGLVVAAIESVANEWSALTLRDGLGSSLAVAGLGPTVFAAAMLVGRLGGDRLIDRYGPVATARFGATAVVVGGGAGLALSAWLAIPGPLLGGLVAAGVGTATLFPLMLAAGDGLDDTGRGVAVASLGARVGFLIVPVVVGGLGERAGLVAAFWLLPVAGATALVALPAALRRGSG